MKQERDPAVRCSALLGINLKHDAVVERLKSVTVAMVIVVKIS
jgi:hypothetical protein